MSKTDHDKPRWYKYQSKESPSAKKFTRQSERHRGKNLIKSGEYDLARSRQTKPSQGWMTH